MSQDGIEDLLYVHKELSVKAMITMSKLSRNTVGNNIRCLMKQGKLNREKRGIYVYYSIKEANNENERGNKSVEEGKSVIL